MRWKRTVQMIEAHCEGEVGRVVTGGTPAIPGVGMAEKMDWLNGEGDGFRRFCVFEPRGHAAMSTNLLLSPARPEADAAFIVLQPDRAHAMSGSNAICVATVLLETGMVEMREPETVVRLDTPAGLVTATAACRDGKCERVSLAMPPSFAESVGTRIDVPGIGEVAADIAFGGIYYALVDAAQVGLRIDAANARALVEAGNSIHRACKEQVRPGHPEQDALNYIAYVMFTGETDSGDLLSATVLPPGRIDRSPCGTGNSARLAVRHSRGEAKEGEETLALSIIGGRFRVRNLGETAVGGRPAVMPEITGRAWIHGIHHIGVDPSDPHPFGYTLSDTWGDALDLLNRGE